MEDQASAQLRPGACRVPGCANKLRGRGYYKKYRVCRAHAFANTVEIDGSEQRYCQQCARFHDVSDFNDGLRSCRAGLERHRQRRLERNQGGEQEMVDAGSGGECGEGLPGGDVVDEEDVHHSQLSSPKRRRLPEQHLHPPAAAAQGRAMTASSARQRHSPRLFLKLRCRRQLPPGWLPEQGSDDGEAQPWPAQPQQGHLQREQEESLSADQAQELQLALLALESQESGGSRSASLCLTPPPPVCQWPGHSATLPPDSVAAPPWQVPEDCQHRAMQAFPLFQQQQQQYEHQQAAAAVGGWSMVHASPFLRDPPPLPLASAAPKTPAGAVVARAQLLKPPAVLSASPRLAAAPPPRPCPPLMRQPTGRLLQQAVSRGMLLPGLMAELYHCAKVASRAAAFYYEEFEQLMESLAAPNQHKLHVLALDSGLGPGRTAPLARTGSNAATAVGNDSATCALAPPAAPSMPPSAPPQPPACSGAPASLPVWEEGPRWGSHGVAPLTSAGPHLMPAVPRFHQGGAPAPGAPLEPPGMAHGEPMAQPAPGAFSAGQTTPGSDCPVAHTAKPCSTPARATSLGAAQQAPRLRAHPSFACLDWVDSSDCDWVVLPGDTMS